MVRRYYHILLIAIVTRARGRKIIRQPAQEQRGRFKLQLEEYSIEDYYIPTFPQK